MQIKVKFGMEEYAIGSLLHAWLVKGFRLGSPKVSKLKCQCRIYRYIDIYRYPAHIAMLFGIAYIL